MRIDEAMSNEMPQTFVRRARLSSKAIAVAIALTLAALIAATVATREESTTAIKTFGPVSTLKDASTEGILVPVVSH